MERSGKIQGNLCSNFGRHPVRCLDKMAKAYLHLWHPLKMSLYENEFHLKKMSPHKDDISQFFFFSITNEIHKNIK